MFQIGRDKWISNEEFKTLPRNEWLQCKVMEWRVINEDLNWIAVMFPWNQCCDMRGCIRRAQELMPNVQAISTINQDGIDTFYYISPGFDEFPDEWRAMNGGPKPPMFQEAPYASENGG